MDQLHAERPDDCKLIRQTELHAEYTVPKKWVKVRPPRFVSDEQKALMSERSKALWEQKRQSETEE